MQVATINLTGRALDHAVGMALSINGRPKWLECNYGTFYVTEYGHEILFEPSRLHAHGGPFITEARIEVRDMVTSWRAIKTDHKDGSKYFGDDEDYLVAAMRCFVRFMLGEFVQIPEELVKK